MRTKLPEIKWRKLFNETDVERAAEKIIKQGAFKLTIEDESKMTPEIERWLKEAKERMVEFYNE